MPTRFRESRCDVLPLFNGLLDLDVLSRAVSFPRGPRVSAPTQSNDWRWRKHAHVILKSRLSHESKFENETGGRRLTRDFKPFYRRTAPAGPRHSAVSKTTCERAVWQIFVVVGQVLRTSFSKNGHVHDQCSLGAHEHEYENHRASCQLCSIYCRG